MELPHPANAASAASPVALYWDFEKPCTPAWWKTARRRRLQTRPTALKAQEPLVQVQKLWTCARSGNRDQPAYCNLAIFRPLTAKACWAGHRPGANCSRRASAKKRRRHTPVPGRPGGQRRALPIFPSRHHRRRQRLMPLAHKLKLPVAGWSALAPQVHHATGGCCERFIYYEDCGLECRFFVCVEATPSSKLFRIAAISHLSPPLSRPAGERGGPTATFDFVVSASLLPA